jgi:Family of unknown function (DUF5662)
MKNLLICLMVCWFVNAFGITADSEAQAAFKYLLCELEQDDTLTYDEQQEKVQKFKIFAEGLSKETSSLLIDLLLQETRIRIFDILQHAEIENEEIDAYLAEYEEAIARVKNMSVEIARQMLFFVAELKIHRQYVYDFGVALGCPGKQLLRHDLCKLCVDQFEGYARYFRGGRLEEDKLAYLAAWEIHQHEEHHHESYNKEGFDFDHFPEERLRNNMLESVADLLAATKQRGGGTLIDWLVNIFPKKNPHPRLLPYLEEGLRKAHAFYLQSEENPDSDSLFNGLPCWNSDVEEVFKNITLQRIPLQII